MQKITITPYNVNHALKWEDNQMISGYLVGSNRFGLRQIANFDLAAITTLCQQTNKQVIVNVTKIIHNHELEELKDYLIALDQLAVDYIIFSDFAVYNLIKNNNLKLKTIYSTETTITNNSFTKFANDLGINGVDLAKEITYQEIKEITENKQSKVMINLHSHIYMYQSVRKLISNYATVQNQEYNLEREYYLYDEERNNYYPLIENMQGTHLLSSSDLCLINHLDKVADLDVDFLVMNGFGYRESIFDQIITLYLEAIKQYENDAEAYKNNKRNYLTSVKTLVPHKKMGTGFYFKKTIY